MTTFSPARPVVADAPLEGAASHAMTPSPIWTSIGFIGIQFAWALQMGQMSPLLERLGSEPWLTSLIWAAGPVTGVFVQPIVGVLSDRHQSAWGRRRPFIVGGALLVATSLLLMPHVAWLGQQLQQLTGNSFAWGLLLGALLLWVLDASINTIQGPYRALVPDVFPKSTDQTRTFALMSQAIGLGAVLAFWIGFQTSNVPLLFSLGAGAIVVALGLTAWKTPEQPIPQASETAATKLSWSALFFPRVTLSAAQKQLCLAHSFTWFGLMCLFIFFATAVPKIVFHAQLGTPGYDQGVQWASLCFAALNAVCFLVSPAIATFSAKLGQQRVHVMALGLMSLSLVGLAWAPSPAWALGLMACLGVGWATTLAIPFAMLTQLRESSASDADSGALMGVFNMFIAAPGLLCSLAVGPLMSVLHQQESFAFLMGSAAIAVSAVLFSRIKSPTQSPNP